MKRMLLWLRYKAAIGITIRIILGLIVLAFLGYWVWGILVDYIEPKGSTGRKDVVQVFAVIAAGVVALIGGIVGIFNLSVAWRNLQQQRDLGQQRAEEDALQAYFEQMGSLLTNHNLIDTDRGDIRQLANAHTLTVLARLDGERKGSVVRFLYGAGLIYKNRTVVNLTGATLTGAILIRANLENANLSNAYLQDSYLMATSLVGADLRATHLADATLDWVNLTGADLKGADVSEKQLASCASLDDATMPDGQKYEEWLKSKGREEDEENSGPS
jgi:hypothetical protein